MMMMFVCVTMYSVPNIAVLMLTLTIQFATLYPFSSYIYSAGGYAALFSGSMAALLSFIFFLADVAYFSAISRETSMQQKKFEFANAVFILYVFLQDDDADDDDDDDETYYIHAPLGIFYLEQDGFVI